MARLVLPPGFRFHPTDEELVCHYLRRKVCGKKIDFEAIAEIDLYKFEPWDLPEKSLLQTRDLEWYFFIPRDRKYMNGSRTNRATEKGYWKSTGKDRYISSASRTVGTKKTLVYYNGRAPKGERTNWVIHEYRLNDSECERVHVLENGFVLCRLYQKSGSGPKNGEQYGAPVEDDEFESSPGIEQDRCGSFTANLFEAGAFMVNGNRAESPVSISGNTFVSKGSSIIEQRLLNSDIQPRNSEMIDSASNTVSEVLEGQRVLPYANGLAMGNLGHHSNPNGSSMVPSECHEEESILRQLYELVSNPDEAESREALESVHRYVEDALPPRDGDFLELDDLLTASNSENAVKLDSNKITNSLDYDCKWEDSTLGYVFNDKKQDVIKGTLEEAITLHSAQMGSPSCPTSLNSQYQLVRDYLLDDLLPMGGIGNEEMAVTHNTDSFEPQYEDVLDFFDQISACAIGDKSFGLEELAVNMQKGLSQADVLRTNMGFSTEDGQYYDALSFTDVVEMHAESRSPTRYDVHGTLVGNGGALPASEDRVQMQSEGYSAHQESLVKATDILRDGFYTPQAEGVTSAVGGQPASPLSLLWSCLDSLPTLPASAADLSPKASASRGSLRMSFVGKEKGKFKMNGEHATNFELRSKLPRSPSFSGQRGAVSKRWSIGFWGWAVVGGVFGLLAAGGAWKLLGGVYRFMMPNEG